MKRQAAPGVGGDGGFQRVELLTRGFAFVGAHRAQCFHFFGNQAFFAQNGDAHGVQLRQIGGGFDLRQQIGLKRFHITH